MQHYVICFHLKYHVHVESLRNLFSSRLQDFHGKTDKVIEKKNGKRASWETKWQNVEKEKKYTCVSLVYTNFYIYNNLG